MALNNLVRSASRVVPSAIRAFAGRRWCSHRHYRSALSATATATVSGRLTDLSFPRSLPSFLHHYSTATNPDTATETSSDKALLDCMQYEIECITEAAPGDEDLEKVPEDFPFEIVDHVGTDVITLNREFQGETISVQVYMPNLVTGGGAGDGEDHSNQSSLPLVVKTSKKSGPYLEFGCTAFPDEIVIDSLSVKYPDMSEDRIPYEGPDFAELDENLQKALHRYLEVRGIRPSTTNFFHGYMIEKDTKEYTAWLKKITNYLLA